MSVDIIVSSYGKFTSKIPLDEHEKNYIKENPSYRRMTVSDKDNIEKLWVKLKKENICEVRNIPVSDLFNYKDLVEVEFDKDDLNNCKFVKINTPVNDSCWVMLITEVHLNKLIVLLATYSNLKFEEFSQGIFKLTWPLTETTINRDLIIKTIYS